MPNQVELVARVRNVTVKFHHNTALEGISLEIYRGTVLLLGSNGSGKTTLIKVLTGLIKPTHGSVEVLGLNPVKNASLLYRRILYVRDTDDLPHTMRVSTLVELLSEKYGEKRVHVAVKHLDLEDHLSKRIGELSKGLRRRVAMIEAISSKRELVILDEPFSGLDLNSRRVIAEAFEFMSREGSLLIASHLPLRMSINQMIVLEGGKLAYSGSYQEDVAREYLCSDNTGYKKH